MVRPERYQMGFDFVPKPDRSLVYYELGFIGQEHPEGVGRFVRQLREEVVIRTPQDAAQHFLTNVFSPFEAFDQEELWVLLVNTKNRITHEAMIYRGTVDTVNIRLAEFFKEPIRVNAPALRPAHNHPSGAPEPSPADIRVTEDCYLAGNLLGIALLDHIVVGRETTALLREDKWSRFSKMTSCSHQ